MNNINKSLLIIAHGSKKKVSNIEIHQLANNIFIKNKTFNFVQACFLEIADPSISQGIKICVDRNASSITIFPYFLAAGRHVIEDIPQIINYEKLKYPKVSIKMLPYLGSSPVIIDIVRTLAENSINNDILNK